MKNNNYLKLLFVVQLGVIFLFTSCSHLDSTEVDHSFKVAINAKQEIKDFKKVKFEPFEDLNLGFFNGEIWLRLDIDNHNLPASYMFVNNDVLNHNYTLYKLDTLRNSLKLVDQIEDKSKEDYRTFNFPNPNFKIDLGSNEHATYLITTKSDGRTVDATPQIMSMTSYSRFINDNSIWSIVFLGVIVCLLLINIYQWSIYKQRIYFYYTFYMVSTFLMYAGLEGYLFNFEFNKITIDHIIFLSVRLWVLFLILYTSNFLDIKTVAPKYYKFIKWCLLIVLGGTTIYQFVFFNSSISHLHYFENTLSFLWLFLILFTIISSAKIRKLELKYYLIPLLCFLLFIAIGLIDGHIQILPGNPFFYIKLGTIVEFIGFTYFMTILIRKKLERTNKLEDELHKNKLDLTVASKELEEKTKLLSIKENVDKTDLISIFKMLENSLSSESDWKEFKLKFKDLNPDFLNMILSNHPDLSKSEIRLLTLIKIGYSQKEIANVLNIAPDSVKKAKSRVRKKMNLPESVTINHYLLKF